MPDTFRSLMMIRYYERGENITLERLLDEDLELGTEEEIT